MARTKQTTPARAKRVQAKRSDCTPIARSPGAPTPLVGGDVPPTTPPRLHASGEEGTPLTWAQAFDAYYAHLRARRCSERTIYCLHRDLVTFQDKLAPALDAPGQVQLADLRRYQLSLFNRRLAASTVARITSHLRSFFKFLFLEELLPSNPADRLEQPKVPPRPPGAVLKPKQVQRLVQATAESKTPLLDRALLEVLYCTGVRRSELLALDVFDVDHQERTLFVRAGKGEKPRLLPLAPTCYEALTRYLEYGRPDQEREPTPALFLGARGGRLGGAQLARILHELGDRAGLDVAVTPHLFRRSCATGLLVNGTNLKVIQAVLGHDNLETTSVYLSLSAEDIREEVLSRHPRERFE